MTPEAREVVWTSPSRNSEDSMPLGGCGVGLNLWVENGAILIYFQQSGSFDEHNGFPKLGRLRLTPESGTLIAPRRFEQRLDTQTATVDIAASDGRTELAARVWASQNAPGFHISLSSGSAQSWFVRYESWRTVDRVSPAQGPNTPILTERHDVFGFWQYPHDLVRHRDNVAFVNAGDAADAVLFYHQNDNDDLAFDKEMDQQGFAPYKSELYNPLENLVFGGIVLAPGAQKAGVSSGTYIGTPFEGFTLRVPLDANGSGSVHVLTEVGQYDSLDEWKETLLRRADRLTGTAVSADYERTKAWWEEYWRRSYIVVKPQGNEDVESRRVSQLSKNYRLFRFMQGANHAAAFPMKFNGGLFTYDSVLVRDVEAERGFDPGPHRATGGRDYGPDYRAWGGGSLTQQNQRLLYWPMIKSGDWDLMQAQLDWFLSVLPAAELRSRLAWEHDGASFAEQINNYGIPLGSHFGWRRSEELGLGDQINFSVDKHYSSQLEFAWMMIELARYSGLDLMPYLPFIESVAEFFYHHFESDGELDIFPSTALETYKNARNPVDVIAGLDRIYRFLCSSDLVDTEQKARYRTRLHALPSLPYRDIDGRQTIAPAASWDTVNNFELPQLYPVFPFERFGVGKPNYEVARDTWSCSGDDIEGQKSYVSWHQDGIFCARLGLVEEAVEILQKKLSDGGRRFPAYWGPGHDWVPDFNWGGSGMIQLQDMLLQADDRRILLFPCWPRRWDVSFKLHAPFSTTVECKLRSGTVTDLVVRPRTRSSDVEMLL